LVEPCAFLKSQVTRVDKVASAVDILMISHARADYYRRSLLSLLAQVERAENARVWLWQNGNDPATLDVFNDLRQHPLVAESVHSGVNQGLRTPTNWMWEQSNATFVSKVDDDCVLDDDWIARLISAHASIPKAGVLGSWRFYEEDSHDRLIIDKMQRFTDGSRLFRNHWVQGSGYLAKRELIEQLGPLRATESFPDWCLRVARAGRTNGWPYPLIHEEHFDDPRSPETMFTSDEIFLANRPLHAKMNGVQTLRDWEREQNLSALGVQKSHVSWYHYFSLRQRLMRRARLEITKRVS
jgi:GT2 family glycosyltransferase